MKPPCCEHNPCPQRPRWWLGRFTTRPWQCPDCDQTWHTEWYGDKAPGHADRPSDYSWIRDTNTPATPTTGRCTQHLHSPLPDDPNGRLTKPTAILQCNRTNGHDGRHRFNGTITWNTPT